MASTELRSSTVPPGLIVEAIEIGPENMLVTARSRSMGSTCPTCGRMSKRVHSRYRRSLGDLPSLGRAVRIFVQARRFRCSFRDCRTRIFAERFDAGVTRPFSRRTARLDRTIHHLGLVLGGRPAANLARRLLMPASKDTMLRTVRRYAVGRSESLEVIGIDDWAWKRGQRYGTIICDLERRRIVDLLPDREPATIEGWLAGRADIRVIARDRGGGYGQAAARACPDAVQVADRWHLMENASAAFLTAVRRSMREIRGAVGADQIDPGLLTHAERLQYEGFLRREEANVVVCGLAKEGMPIKEIVRRTGHSRQTVRRIVRGLRGDVFRVRQSSLTRHLTRLDCAWRQGCRNGAELWRRLRADGFRGSLRVVTEWATRRRQNEQAGQHPRKCPSARAIARLMTIKRDHLAKADALTVATIETAVPRLAAARDLTHRFHSMIRSRDGAAFEPWIKDAAESLLGSFAAGIVADRAAVRAAIDQPWSNGQTEAQITKLKLVKRQMYGRAKLDLLRARLIGTQ